MEEYLHNELPVQAIQTLKNIWNLSISTGTEPLFL